MNYLHVLKRPKKRLLKAKDEARTVQPNPRGGPREWGQNLLRRRSPLSGPDQMGLKGDWTLPVLGGKACYYSGVCLEAGEVEAMEIAGNSNAETSTAFLRQLREKHPGPLVVIWDNGPAHRGEAIRSYLTTPDLQLRLVALPAWTSMPTKPSGTGPGKRSRPTNAGNKSPSPREDE